MPVGLWSQIRPKGAGSVGKVSVKIAVQIQIISRGQNFGRITSLAISHVALSGINTTFKVSAFK